MSTTGPLDPVSKGGIAHALVGSLIIIGICLVVTVPLGISCAVFLNETHSRATTLVRTVVDAMPPCPRSWRAVHLRHLHPDPRVRALRHRRVAGRQHHDASDHRPVRRGGVAARGRSLREASAALGAPLWRTVWFVVLPTARSGLATAIILGVARGVGETAPVLLTSGVTGNMNLDPTKAPMMSLPLATFDFVGHRSRTCRPAASRQRPC